MNKSLKILFCGLFFVVTMFSCGWAMGERPLAQLSEAKAEQAPVSSNSELRVGCHNAIENRNFKEAGRLINKLLVSDLADGEKDLVHRLAIYAKIEASAVTENIAPDELLNTEQSDRLAYLYNEAWYLALSNTEEAAGQAKEVLIYILYLQQDNFRAKMFMNEYFNGEILPYKIEDVYGKYLDNSKIHFYGGNYSIAIKDLEFLKVMDGGSNDLVFERLGSSYYMTGEVEKALASWTEALLLNPNNKKLEEVIVRAKANMEKKQEVAQAQKAEESNFAEADLQLLGVFSQKEVALSYAQELKSKGYFIKVEKLYNKKWAVKVPRSQIINEKK